MKFLFLVLCFFGLFGGVAERMQARARCREVRVHRKDVVIRFTCEEDAKLFAEDFRQFIRE